MLQHTHMLITNQLFVLFLPLLAAHIGLLPLLIIPALNVLHRQPPIIIIYASKICTGMLLTQPTLLLHHRGGHTEKRRGKERGDRPSEREDSRTRGGAARRGEDSGQVSR